MDAKWHFYEQVPTGTVRNPISGEFFSTEAVGNVAEALIREGIQNSLDARCKGTDGRRKSAHVRIFVSGDSGALKPPRVRHWFHTLWPHITAPGNGLANHPDLDASCPFIVFEDFGTTGLAGETDTNFVVEGVANHFLNFFRAEGHSDKGVDDRGSWGVGKTVFTRASRINSFLSLTVRSGDRAQLLFGRSIIKYHQVSGQHFTSDGYFGIPRDDGFMLPTEDTSLVDNFRRDFHIQRKGESGLSIVVPWYQEGEEDGISQEKIMGAVLRGFFYPILMGGLSVTVATPSSEFTLEANTIVQRIKSIGGNYAREILPIVELAEWAQTRTINEFIALEPPPENNAQVWSDALVPKEVATQIRQLLAQQERVAIRVPMSVQERCGDPRPTHFNLFMEQSENDSDKPTFIRDELIISDVRPPRVSQIRSLVIVEDKPLASFLRDAETPAHTQWNQNTSKFKDKYKFGPKAITFVRKSVSELLRILNQEEQKPDPSITIDYFSIPKVSDDDEAIPARRRKSHRDQGEETATPIVPPGPPKLRRFRIEKLGGGFAVRAGDPEAALPPAIEIRVAYDVRRGSALKKYHAADFDIGREPIQLDSNSQGVTVLAVGGNRLVVAPNKPGFNLDVTGFDADRDLYIRAEVKESPDVD